MSSNTTTVRPNDAHSDTQSPPGFIQIEADTVVYSMTEAERTHIVEMAAANPYDPHTETTQFINFIAKQVDQWATFMRVARMLYWPNIAAVRFNGCPIGKIGPTPASGQLPENKDTVSETVLIAMAIATGSWVVTFLAESKDPFHNVRPEESNRGVQTGTGSGITFRDHNEAAFAEGRPDAVALSCLRGSPDAGTTVAPVRAGVARMQPWQVADARGGQYGLGVPNSFVGDAETIEMRNNIAIVEGPEYAPVSRVNFAAMSVSPCASTTAMQSLKAFEDALAAVRRTHYLTPGTVLLIDNHAAVHGRTSFSPEDFGDNARWIQRAYFRTKPPTANEIPQLIGFGL